MAACGGTESDPAAPSGGAGSAGTPAGGAGAGGSAGSGGSSGAGGAAAAGGTGGAGQPVVADCAGPFTDRVVQFTVPAPGLLASPAIAPGELELFYVQYDVDPGPGNFRRTTRATKDALFAPGEAVAELDAACQPDQRRSIDLSLDGLRAFVMCFSADDPYVTSGDLRIARRETPASAFVLDAMSYGRVGASPSLTADELSAYSSYESGIGEGPLQVYTRASTDLVFGTGRNVSGIGENLSSPDIGPDQRTIFAGFLSSVVRATRADAASPFGPPEVVVEAVQTPGTGVAIGFGAPDAAGDCRTLYVVQLDTAVPETEFSIVEVRR